MIHSFAFADAARLLLAAVVGMMMVAVAALR